MGNPKVVHASGEARGVSSASAKGTVVSSGTAFVRVEGQTAVQPVVIPELEIGPQRFREDFARIKALVEHTALNAGSPDQPGFYVDEVEVRLDVTAEGGLRLLGSGVDASATAGVRVLFRRGKPSGS